MTMKGWRPDMKLLLAFLLLVSLSGVAQIKDLPPCQPGYDYILVKHKFICTDITKLNNERLDQLEEQADNLVPHLRIAIALCKSGQTWAEIDNNHPDAQQIRAKLMGPDHILLKVEIEMFDAYIKTLSGQKLNAFQQTRFTGTIQEVTQLEHELTRELRRYMATQH